MQSNQESCNACLCVNLHDDGKGFIRCQNCGLIRLKNTKSEEPDYSTSNVDNIYSASKNKLFHSCLKTLTGYFPQKGKLLDIGSARGDFLKLALSLGWSAEGIEINSRLLSKSSSNLKIYNQSLEELRLPDNSYEAVTAFEVLSQMPAPAGAVMEACRVLKPGGRIYIREFNGVFHQVLCSLSILSSLGFKFVVFHEFNFSPKSLRCLLSRAGFKNVKVRNSRPTSGDPYGTGGMLGPGITGSLKMLYYYFSQIIYFLSFGTLLTGSSLNAEAEK